MHIPAQDAAAITSCGSSRPPPTTRAGQDHRGRQDGQDPGRPHHGSQRRRAHPRAGAGHGVSGGGWARWPRPALPRPALSCPVLSCPVLPCPALSRSWQPVADSRCLSPSLAACPRAHPPARPHPPGTAPPARTLRVPATATQPWQRPSRRRRSQRTQSPSTCRPAAIHDCLHGLAAGRGRQPAPAAGGCTGGRRLAGVCWQRAGGGEHGIGEAAR
jgi:hypothetical protein